MTQLEYYREWKKKNADKVNASNKRYREKNKEALKKRSKAWVEDNKERRSEISRKYTQNNKDIVNKAKRDRRKINPEIRNDRRIPKNLPHVQYFKKETLEFRKNINKMNKGLSASDHFTMDHIIPLKHPNVCGLNCPANYQILSRKENAFKNNKWDGSYDNNSWREDYVKNK